MFISEGNTSHIMELSYSKKKILYTSIYLEINELLLSFKLSKSKLIYHSYVTDVWCLNLHFGLRSGNLYL